MRVGCSRTGDGAGLAGGKVGWLGCEGTDGVVGQVVSRVESTRVPNLGLNPEP